MADKQSQSDLKSGEGKSQEETLEAGKGKAKESKSQTENSNLSIELEKLKKENENLRGTQSVVTKQYNELIGKLKSAFSNEDTEGGKEKNPLAMIEKLSAKINSIESENQKAKALELLYKQIDNYTDEKGKPLSENIKKFLREDIQVSEPKEELIKEAINKKVSTLAQVFEGKGVFTSDNRPEGKSAVTGSRKAETANEIIEAMKK